MHKRRKAPVQVHEDSVSLNKYISDTGFCSRREADDYIAQGRVTINEEPAAAGNRVFEGDVVEIDGEPVKKKIKTVYIAFNKPLGVTCTTDRKDKTNIVDFISFKQRIFPVGRLDKDSEGLIFLTNDGNIVNKILRAGNQHEKEYIVTVDKPLNPEFIKSMSEGVRILGTKTKPCKVVSEGKTIFRITLTQGMNRQIRRMCQVLGYKVKKLVRVRIMNVHLGKLPAGHWRFLTEEEIGLINKMVAQSAKTEEASRQKSPAKTQSKPVREKQNKEEPEEEKQKPKKKTGYSEFRKAGKKK